MVKQEINPKVLELLDRNNVPRDEGVLCLLAIYHGLTEIYTFEEKYELIFKQINHCGIVIRDYGKTGVLWNVPLYDLEAGIAEDNWEWVRKEYRTLFSQRNPARSGGLKACIDRMKDFFSKHPEVRKQDIIDAAELYLSTTTNPEYIMSADYFIWKDKGKNQRSMLETYLELSQGIKEKKEAELRSQQQRKFLR